MTGDFRRKGRDNRNTLKAMWNSKKAEVASQGERPQEKPHVLTQLGSYPSSLQYHEKINFSCMRSASSATTTQQKIRALNS